MGGGGGVMLEFPDPGIFCCTKSSIYNHKITPPVKCSDIETVSSNAKEKFSVLEQNIHCI